MARVKRAVNAQKKRRVVLERASGYRGQRSRLYRKAKEQVTHSLVYSYRDRKKRKGDFRRLWIQRINAAARQNGMTYNRFIQGMKARGWRSTARSSPSWPSTTRRPLPPSCRPLGPMPPTRRHAGMPCRRSHPERGRGLSELTSPRAPRVQAARRLAKRAFRVRDRRFLAEGPQAVREALATGAGVREVF